MKIRLFYIYILIAFLMGLFMIWFSIPSDHETALIYLKDRRFEDAYAIYEDLYSKGDRGLNIIYPLVDLDLLHGDTAHAVALMEGVLKENPDLIDGKRRLADLYKFDNRPADYLKTLEDLVSENPTEAGLLELTQLYEEYELTDKRIKAYDQLVDLGNRSEKVLYSLAFLKAQKDQIQEAVSDLILLPFASYSRPDTANLMVNLLLDNNQPLEAYYVATEYLKRNNSVDHAIVLSQIFDNHSLPSYAWDLLIPYQDYMIENAGLFSEFVIFGGKIGKNREIYALSRDLYQKGLLPYVVLDDFLDLAIRQKDKEMIELVLSNSNPNQFSNRVIIDLLQYAASIENQALVDKIVENLSPKRIERSALLQVAIYLTKKPDLDAFKVFYADLVKSRDLSDSEKMDLMSLLYNQSRQDEAIVIFDSVTGLEEATSSQIEEYVLIALELKQVEKAKALVDQLLANHPEMKEELVAANLYISASLEQNDLVIQYLVNSPKWNGNLVRSLFTIANINRNAELAYFTATLWDDHDHTLESRKAVVEALILAKMYEDAFPLLEALLQEDPQSSDLIGPYLTAYLVKSKDDPVEFGKFKNRLFQYLLSDKISDEIKAQWGYSFIEEKALEPAFWVFKEISKDKPFKDPFSQDLLYLYEGKLPPELLMYVVERVGKERNLDEKAEWIDYLLDNEEFYFVVELVTGDDLSNRKIALAFLTALGEMSMRHDLRRYLLCLADVECDLVQLKALAKIGLDYGAHMESAVLYRKAQMMAPCDKEIAKYLGYSDFLIGYYSESYENLIFALCNDPKDYKAQYFVGEILWTWECRTAALCYFERAEHLIHALQADEEEEKEAQGLLALIYFRQKREIMSIQQLAWMNTRWPKDLDIVSSYADILITSQYYRTALCLLNEYVTTPAQDCWKFEEKQGQALLRVYQYKARVLKNIGNEMLACQIIQELQCCIDQIDDKWLVYEMLGEFETGLLRYRSARDAYCLAKEWNPYNESFDRSVRDLYQPWRSFISGSYEMRITSGNLSEHIWRNNYLKRFDTGHFFDGIWEFDNFSGFNVLNPNTGDSVGVSGFRYRTLLSWGYDAYNGDRYLFGLYIGANGFGGKLEYQRHDAKGFNGFTLEYRYPSWEYDQVIAYRGRMDQIRYDRLYRFDSEFYIEGYSGFRFWSISNIRNVAKSWKNDWSFVYSNNGLITQRFMGEEGYVNLIYNLDAEYVIDRKRGIDPDGESFARFNLITQETHTLLVIANKVFNRMIRAEALVGYSYNRFGTGGLDLGLTIVLQKPRCWEIRFDASRMQSTTAPGQQEILKIEAKIPL